MDGLLSAQAALTQAARWDAHPRELVKASEKTHIFTHIRWKMTGYTIECASECPAFEWAGPERFRQDVALPPAFRKGPCLCSG